MSNQLPIAADDIRKAYLNFFTERGHLLVPSASIIPAGDPTLLLTSAGMVPFKPYFTGDSIPPSSRLTSVQKCFRATDIDEVGDTTHLTFFEMLGNFSIGDYFKQGAVEFAWDFVTKVLKLPPERLWATVYLDDDETFDLWVKTGIPAERIRRFGDADNYWGPAGKEGPCGPCSEIHYDFGGPCRLQKTDDNCGPNCECGRFLELWNLVFMQFYQDLEGDKTPLSKGNIDTGMGLERAALILQGADSLYETDLFKPILNRVAEISNVQYGSSEQTDIAMRVVAEHARSATFLIVDGVVPGNEGRGYVLRRIIRRSIRYARHLGVTGSYLGRIAESVVDSMHAQYPELGERKAFIMRTLEIEEEKFQQAIQIGMPLLDHQLIPLHQDAREDKKSVDVLLKGLTEHISEGVRAKLEIFLSSEDGKGKFAESITGIEAFFLYDSYGFPLELTEEIANEYGFGVDRDGFDAEMEEQRERGRAASQFDGGRDLHRTYDLPGLEESVYVGYEQLEIDSSIAGILLEGSLVTEAQQGAIVEVILKETPFYSEGGGQVGDTGVIQNEDFVLKVMDTQKPIKNLIVHTALVERGIAISGSRVSATVDYERRRDIARNHTATHLLHSALRKVLGSHVRQAGSLVTPDRLRFDFTHIANVTPEELHHVQQMVNDVIRQNLLIDKQETTYRKAVNEGALAFFGDQYGNEVRVVKVGSKDPFSYEVCGGTHADHSGELGYVQVISEGGIGTGMRRIEAVTGRGAEIFLDGRLGLLDITLSRLQTSSNELTQKLDALLEEVEQSRKTLLNSRRDASRTKAQSLLDQVQTFSKCNVLACKIDVDTVDMLREMGDWLRSQIENSVVILGSVIDRNPVLIAMVNQDLVKKSYHAGEIAKIAAPILGGGGGGRPDIAQAGGRNSEKLDEALNAAVEFIKSKEV